jgi:hypothetical protein
MGLPRTERRVVQPVERNDVLLYHKAIKDFGEENMTIGTLTASSDIEELQLWHRLGGRDVPMST